MKSPLPLAALLAAVASLPAAGFTLRLDFNDDDSPAGGSPTAAGWTGVTAAGGTFSGITVGVAAVGTGVSIDDRYREAAGVTTTENIADTASLNDAAEDFIFALNSDVVGEGMDITLGGLQAGRTYPVTLWAWDKSSPNARNAAWSGGGGSGTLTFNGTDGTLPTDAAFNLRSVTFNATASAAGQLVLQGRTAVNSITHNVFLNALEIGDPLAPPTAPTNITLAPAAVGAQAAVGTVVGNFSATDPETGDIFTYTLVSGAGSTHNALFLLGGLDGEQLRVASALGAYLNQTLSIRVRVRDQHGDTFEKALAVLVTNDADNDGLDDTWELQYFPLLTTATGSGDNDGDGLVNTQEKLRGTNPTLADTDGDTLSDGIENNSRVFNGAGNPGTSPVLTDTDGDGIRDDVEAAAANGFATNPNLADTDSDNFADAVEIAQNTSPTNPSSYPPGLLLLRITEFAAANINGLTDGYGEAEDWIEIFNPNATAWNLDAYFLTDDAEQPTKWNFPAVSVPAGGFLVVFASGKNTVDPNGRAHTNFSLESTGEYLAIIQPDGHTVDHEYAPAFPRQYRDVSCGLSPSDGTLRFFGTPTPGGANNAGYDGVVRDTSFSINRGFYDAPFQLALGTLTPGAQIRYTTDGTKPTTTTGTVYAGPITISGTTVVRAIGYKSGWLPTNVDTHTYVFPNQVAAQPAMPAYPPGLPPNWGYDAQVNTNDGAGDGTVPADYAMDQRVVAGAIPGYGVRDALLSIPTMALSLPVDDFFGLTNGIWTHPQTAYRGAAWEKECSLEMIEPDGAAGKSAFQENCIVEIHGNSSRNPWRMQKHSLRVTFRSTVGSGTLQHDLFPESPVKTFNKLVLRACFTDSWGLVSWDPARYRPNDSQYLRDFFMKEIYRRMGQPSTYGAFCHLYVNGHYLGLYNHTERIEDDLLVSHFGGNAADWEINEDLSSPGPRWSAMMALTNYADFPAYVDLVNFADYMLLHIFADSEDWPHHNGYAATNPAIGFPYRFFVWDQEIAFDNHSINKISINTGAGALFQKLRGFAEFRLLFADRVRKHLFNDGVLTAAAAGQLYLAAANRIDKAIVAESARWGDTRSSMAYGSAIPQPVVPTDFNDPAYPPPPNGPAYYYTREQSWLVERDNVINNYLPSLHNLANSYATINKLRPALLYPITNAPDFSQFGGVVANGYQLGITSSSSGTIYFTTNGTDPREANTGNAVGQTYTAPVALTQTGTVKARVKNGAEWSALTEALFIVGTPASAANLVVSKIHYNPSTGADHEYLELMNITAGPIDLSLCAFSGIEFTFPAGTVLNAGARILVVRNSAAFEAQFGSGLPVAGQFTGALENNGEEVALTDSQGADIFRFSFDNAAPWPPDAAGGGRALVLQSPGSGAAMADPASWRPSRTEGGLPGADDRQLPPGDPAADADSDGFSAGLEAAFGTAENSGASLPVLSASLSPAGDALLATFRHLPWQTSGRLVPEHADTAGGWTTTGTTLLSRQVADDGLVEDLWQVSLPAGAESPRHFVRVRLLP